MPISFNCPTCARKFSVAETQAGQRAKCGGCQSILTVPKQSALPMALSVVDGEKIRVTCPCGRAFRTAASAVGKQGTCDQCGAQFIIAAPKIAAPTVDLDELISEGIAQAAKARSVPIERPPEPQVATPQRHKPFRIPRIEISFDSWPVAIVVGLIVFVIMLSFTIFVFQREEAPMKRGQFIAGMSVCFLFLPLLILHLLNLHKSVKALEAAAGPFFLLGLLLLAYGALASLENAPAPVPVVPPIVQPAAP